MSLANVYGIAPISIETSVGVSAVIGGLTRVSVTQGNRILSQIENGELYTTYGAVAGVTPRASFTSRDIVTVLGTTGFGGIGITSDGDDPGIVFYLRKRGAVGTASGSVHRSYTFGNGVLVPRNLSVGHQGNASVSCELLATSADGSTSAAAISDSESTFPTVVTATRDDQWTLYSCTINGATVTGFTGIDITFGATARTVGAQSDVLDTVAVVPSTRPSVRIRGLNPQWVNTTSSVCDILGEQCLHANTSIVLRKRGVTTATAEHIQFTLNGVVYTDQIADGSAESDISCALMLTLNSADGTTSPILGNLGYAIP